MNTCFNTKLVVHVADVVTFFSFFFLDKYKNIQTKKNELR